MGLIKNETPALSTTNNSNTTNHFSHQHPLKLIQQSPNSPLPSLCAGCNCKSHCDSSIYICTVCPFYLHKRCFDMPKKLTHPSHKAHPFTLLPKPVYPTGSFMCDACGGHGTGFSYHCNPCGMDLHILCTIIPLSLTHASHGHKLDLTFESPYGVLDYCCDICKLSGNKQWLYRCKSCRFDVHLKCAYAPPAETPLLQNNPTSFMSNFNQPSLQQQNLTSFMNNLNQPPLQQPNLSSFMNYLNLNQPPLQQQNLTSFMNNLNQPPLQQQNLTNFMSNLNLNQPPSQQQNLTSFMNNLNLTPLQQHNLTSIMNNQNNFQPRGTQQQGFGTHHTAGANHPPPQQSTPATEEVPVAGTSTPQIGATNDVLAAFEAFRQMVGNNNAIPQENPAGEAWNTEAHQLTQLISALNNCGGGGGGDA